MQHTNKTIATMGLGLLLFTEGCVKVQAQSLFPIKAANQQAVSSSGAFFSLYSDIRAHGVGDILTIIINENTTAASTASLKTTRNESGNFFNGTGLFHQLLGGISFGVSSGTASDGNGQTSRTGTLATTLSVVVTQVMPNGNLMVKGSSLMGINKETQQVTITGMVRPADIAPDNTIPSNLVADVNVVYNGKGIVAHTQQEGFLSKILRFLF